MFRNRELQDLRLLTKGIGQRVRNDPVGCFRPVWNEPYASEVVREERILAMDVLHFLRSDHVAIKHALGRLDGADPVTLLASAMEEVAAAVELHLGLERDYLYPEISGAFNGVDALVAAGLANASVIEKKLRATQNLLSQQSEAVSDALIQAIGEVKLQTLSHIEQEERLLLPKLREFVRTEDREDLGQVLLDVQEERRSSRSVGGVNPSTGRRRA